MVKRDIPSDILQMVSVLAVLLDGVDGNDRFIEIM
jgi:hypothetical protein